MNSKTTRYKLKKTIVEMSKKSSLLFGLKQIYKSIRDTALNIYVNNVPIKNKTIVFEAYNSTKYDCSPRAIYEYMLHHDAFVDYQFVWSFSDPSKYQFLLDNPRTSIVAHESLSYYMSFGTAKYWVTNSWVSLKVHKRQDQVALQCWHGTPLKRLRLDIPESANTEHRRTAIKNNDLDIIRYDYFISPSRFATRVFISAFNLKNLKKESILIETGYPRNDALKSSDTTIINKLRNKYGIPDKKKVILYAPTWRDNQHVTDEGYSYSSNVDFSLLQDGLADEYVILFRAHNLITNNLESKRLSSFMIDVSDVDGINDLYMIADVLMTDYSSVFFDYANLGRPIIFYMYDLEQYRDALRGFYVDINTLPGDIVTTEREVIEIIRNLPVYAKRYEKKIQAFSKEYNYLDDGNATRRVVDRVFGS